jgi:predicted GTPase
LNKPAGLLILSVNKGGFIRPHLFVRLIRNKNMIPSAELAGSLFIVAAPSGAGKSTLVNALLAQEPNIRLSISFTTRQPRPVKKMVANTTSPP